MRDTILCDLIELDQMLITGKIRWRKTGDISENCQGTRYRPRPLNTGGLLMKEIKKAVVACKVFYQEILEIVEEHDYQNITVEFLPQGLHNKPDSTQMKDRIQEKIDELEEREDFDYIILAYGYCSGGVEGLKTSRAKLVVPKVHDCIPLLLGEEEAGEEVEAEAGAGSGDGAGDGVEAGAGTGANEGNNSDKTYFLSRGWIDCGGDVYKQHLHLTDSMQDWLDRFAAFQQENERAEIDWQEDDSYHFKRKYSEEDAEFISFECLKGYEAVVLIDNDNLASIHREYAQEKYKFVDRLLEKYRGRGIEYEEVKGDLGFLAELLFPEIYSGEGFEAETGEGSGEGEVEGSEAEKVGGTREAAVEGAGEKTGEGSGEAAVEETGKLLIFPPGEELKLRKHLLGSS